MRRALVLIVVMLATACSSGSDAPPDATPASPSPTATLEDFNGEWCGAVFPLRRAIDNLPTLNRDDRTVQTLDDSVERFDALASGLSEAGFDEAAADARQMADALNDLADALDLLVDYPVLETKTELMRAHGKAIGRMPINELADAHGNCSQVIGDTTELLIDCEEDRTLRAVLVGMLRDAQ